MRVLFWEAMIRAGVSAYASRCRFDPAAGIPAAPGWCANRFGQSFTVLPDGQTVQIGGEHEDHYDPDFCIYNDVFVHGSGNSIVMYGYPQDDFPPTDFHTATLVGDGIYLIGSLGYAGTRRYGVTPVYRLDLATWRIDPVAVSGEPPGWIYRHRAVTVGSLAIRVWGGKVVTSLGDKESHDANPASFVFDLDRLHWQREHAPDPV